MASKGHMLDLSVNTETHEKIRKQQKNRDWLAQNLEQVQAEYAERWVAIFEQNIVASGSTADEVKKELAEDYPSHEVIILQVPKGEISRPV